VVDLANAILFGTALYHLVMGAFVFASPTVLARITKALYGTDAFARRLEDSPAFLYVTKMTGCFALALATLCAQALRFEPAPKRAVLISLAVLFLARTASRWFFRDLFCRAFGSTSARNFKHVVFNLALATLSAAVGFEAL